MRPKVGRGFGGQVGKAQPEHEVAALRHTAKQALADVKYVLTEDMARTLLSIIDTTRTITGACGHESVLLALEGPMLATRETSSSASCWQPLEGVRVCFEARETSGGCSQ